MSSGPCILLCLEAPDAIKKWRTLMGATDPARPKPARSGRTSERRSSSTRRTVGRGGDGGLRARAILPRHGTLLSGRRISGSAAADWSSSVLVGVVIAGLGLLMMAGVPLGRLPGDMTLRRGAFTFYFPLATSILLSVILTLLMQWFRR